MSVLTITNIYELINIKTINCIGGGTPITYTSISSSGANVLIDNDSCVTTLTYGQPIGIATSGSNGYVVAWRGGSTNDYIAKIVRHNNGVVTNTSGSEVVVNNNMGGGAQLVQIDTNRYMAGYRNNNDSGNVYVRTLTASDLTLSLESSETEVGTSSPGATNCHDMQKISTNTAVMCGGRGSTGFKWCGIAHWNGSSIDSDLLSTAADSAAMGNRSTSVAVMDEGTFLFTWLRRSAGNNDRIVANVIECVSSSSLSENIDYTYTLGAGEDDIISIRTEHLGDRWVLSGWVDDTADKAHLMIMSASASNVVIFHSSSNWTSSGSFGVDGYRSSIDIRYILTDPVSSRDLYVIDIGQNGLLLYEWDTTLLSGSVLYETNNAGFDTDEYSSDLVIVDAGSSPYFTHMWVDDSASDILSTQCEIIP